MEKSIIDFSSRPHSTDSVTFNINVKYILNLISINKSLSVEALFLMAEARIKEEREDGSEYWKKYSKTIRKNIQEYIQLGLDKDYWKLGKNLTLT